MARDIDVEAPASVARSVADFAAAHAAPLTLLSAGVGWLLVGLSRSGRDRSRDGSSPTSYAGEATVQQVRARAEQLAKQAARALQAGGAHVLDGAHALEERVADRAGALGSHLSDDASRWGAEASKLGHDALDGVGRAGRRAVEFGDKHPLATGLAILAAGAAAAALLPGTRGEDKWLGAPRDRLIERARRSAADVANKALERTDELRDAIAEFARAAE